MQKISIICLFALSLTALAIAPSLAQKLSASEKATQEATKAWLLLTDTGKYAESWSTAAEGFQKSIPKDKWVAMVKAARDPLGKVKSRRLKLTKFTKDPPNAPKGEYVTLQFNTDFARKAGAVETVAEMQEKDGKWRTIGYRIH